MTDPLQLADWIEVQCLVARDRSASRMELQSLLRISAVVDEEEQDRISLAAFSELERRRVASGEAYPFDVLGSLIQLRGQRWQEYPAYVFCLLLSYLGVRKRKNLDPTRLFEEIARQALSRYVSGPAERFGFPRPTLPKSFIEAVGALCLAMREGGKARAPIGPLNAKDDALDVAAWRQFPDENPGKIIIFAQCATGGDWFEKRSELSPDSFCRKWMEEQPAVLPMKAFVIPHRVEAERWRYLSCDAGIVLDRCRVAYLSHGLDRFAKHTQWARATLEEAKG